MNPLAWLIGLVFPACGFPPADGLPTPRSMDVAHIVRPSSPNIAVAAPDGFAPSPDPAGPTPPIDPARSTPPIGPAGSTPPIGIITPHYKIAADRLFALVQEVAGGQPRTWQSAVYHGQPQIHYVARGVEFNFPDLIVVQVEKDGRDGSLVIACSSGVYGRSDFGVNRRRVETWLAALQTKLPSSSER